MNLFIEIAYFIRDWWPLVAAFFSILFAGYKGVATITASLRRITNQLERLNDKLAEFERDRAKIWDKLDVHEEVLDQLTLELSKNSDHIAEAEKDIENLYREVKKK